MRIWTIILYTIIIIYQNHVYYTAPVGKQGSATNGELKTKFGKIADQIINPKWTFNDQDSKKKKNDSDPSDNTVKENDENQIQPNTPNNDNERRPKKNNKRRRKKSNNKGKSNKRKQNNIRRNGRHRWYKMVTVDYLLVNLPEYRNHENEQNIVLILGDGEERKIELNEHVEALSMKNLNNNQLIRKKRDYNNTFQLQNKLQTKNVKREDLKANEKYKLNFEENDRSQEEERQNKKLENEQNVKKKKIYKTLGKSRGPNSYDKELSLIDNLEDDENSMNSNSIENSNENMNFLNLKNSNKNKFHHFLKNKIHPTNKSRNKLRRPNYAKKLGKTSGKNYSKPERSPLKTVKQKPNSLKNLPKISKYQPQLTTKGNADTATDIPELSEIDSMMNEMNSNTDENLDSQNNDLYTSSLDTQLEIQNYSHIEDNKERDILNNIKHPVKSKSKKKGKQLPHENKKHQNKNKKKIDTPIASKNINEKRSNQKTNKLNSPNTKDILIISYDEPENTTKVNSDTAENIPESDEFDTLINAMDSNSDEKLDDQTNGSYQLSLETKQEIPNYSDIEDIKEHDLLNNIKHPSKTKSKKLGKKKLDDNDELPNKLKQKLTTSLESNNNNEKGPLQKSIKPLAPNLNEIPIKTNDVPKLTTGGNYDKLINTPEQEEIDNLMDAMDSNSDEKLDDQTNGSYPSSLETKQEIPNYSDIEDIKEHDILNNIKHPTKKKSKKLGKKKLDDNDELPKKLKQKLTPSLESNNNNEKGPLQKSIKPLPPNLIEIPIKANDVPKLTTGGNYDKLINTPEQEEIDNLMDAMDSNSDEKLDDQTNGSYPSSLETKQEIPNYSDIEDIKEHDILKNIKHPTKKKSKKLGKKKLDDNDELPKKLKQKLTPSLESNNNNEKGPLQKSIKPHAPNLNEIPIKTNDVPKLTTGGNYDKLINTPEQEEIDNLMDVMDSNSDENLDDQTNVSYPSSLETEQEIPNYSDIEDIKQHNILNNIKHPPKPKSKKMGKKQSDDNDELPKNLKQKLTPSLESNNNNEKGPLQKSIKPHAPNLNEIPIKTNDVPKLTTGGNYDKLINTPEQEEIDNLMDAMDSNSDEKLNDQTNGSYPSSLETEQEIPNYSDIEDIKEHDILNNIKHPSKPKSKKMGKKQSDDNDELPKNLKQKLTPSLESNNNNEKGPLQKSIKPHAPNLNEIPIKANDVPKLTTGGNYDKLINTPEQEEIDNLMDVMDSNSDENLDDQTNVSYPSSLETEQEIPNYSDIEDIKQHDILNNIKHPSKPKSKKMGKKQSDDNDELPKNLKQKLTPSLKSNNNNEKGPLQKSIKPHAPNLNEIKIKANDVPKLNTGGNYDKLINTPEQEEIDNLMDAMDSNSDEKLDDQTNGSYPSSLETEQEIPNYSDIEDIKEHDILNNIKHPSKPKSKKMGKKQSDDNDELPKNLKQKLTPSLESNNNNEKGPLQKSIKPHAPNLNEIPIKANDVPKLTTGGNYDKLINTPEQEEIDNLMDVMDSNSDENLDDQTNVSYPSSLETEQEIPNYSDIEDIKEHDILNNIKHPSKPKSKKMGKKQSDDNDELPKNLKQKLTPSLESNNNNEKEPLQKSIKPHAPNLNEIPMKANDVPKLTTGGNYDKLINTPEQEEIDNLMDAMDSNSDEKLDDQTNGSYPSSLETKQEIPNYSDIEDIKQHDILNNIKHPSKSKSKKMGKKQSDDNDELPKKFKQKLTPSLESNNNNEKGPLQKSIKPLAPNLKEIPIKANDVADIADSNDNMNFTDIKPDDQSSFINDHSYEKAKEEKPRDKSIVLVPKTDKRPKSEKGLSSDETVDKNSKMDIDGILHNVPKPNNFESEPLKPISNDDAVSGKINVIPTQSILKDDKDISHNIPENQKINDLVDKSVPSSIEELLNNPIDEDGLQLPSINFDETPIKPIEKNDNSLPNSEDYNIAFSIPHDHNTKNIFDKKKSMENLNPNSKAIIEKHNINEDSISNKHDKPNVYSKPESIGNTGKDVEMLDISDDYNNLGGITMEDSDLKKIDDKSPTTKGKQDKRITKKNKSNPNVNYKTTKPEIADSIGNMNFTDIKPDDQSSFINDHSYEKAKEEKPRDKSIVLVPKTDKRPKSEKGLSSDETVDKNSKMDIDGILHNVPKPNNFESEPLKPISNDDAVSGKINVIPTQSILKDDKDISHNIPENQKINDLVDKSVPSSIEELLNNPIDEDGLQLPSINFDETPIKPIEKNDNSLPNSEDYNIAFSIPHDHNTKNIFDKKKSMENLNPNSKAIIEKPNINEESISNKHDKPNVYSKPESIGNTGKDIEMLDISDDYNNLGGITMEDSDLKKIDDKSPTTKGKQDKRITKKNKSNPNVNYKTTKPEIADSIGNMNFTDIKPDDQSSFINDHSYEKAKEEKPRDKSIVLVPKTDKRPKSEKGLSSDETVDKNSKMDIDGILHNVPKPNNFESEPLKPISNDDAVSGKINVIPTQSILKDDKDISHNIPENQKINDLDDKSVPSSIEELLNNPIDEDGLQLPSINFDETPIKPIEKNDNSLPNSEDYNIAFSIPHDHNTKNIFDKKKSMENLNPNSKAIIEKHNINEDSISNKHDKPNVYSKPESIGNTGKDVEMLDISDDYNNLGGITMEDSDLKKIDDKSPTTKGKQDKRITKKNKSNPNVNYKTTKPEIADSIGNMNFTDIKPDDQSSFINDHSYEKAKEEKPRDKSIVLVPKTDKRPKSEKGLSSDETVDKNSKMDIDGILHNVPKPNNFESEPLKPISNDDAVSGKINVIPTQSILKDDKDISHNIPENQKINDLVDKSVPSSIEELLNNPIDEDGLQLPSINFDETPIKPIEKNDNSLPNSEDYNIAFSIPHDHNTKNIFDKKKTMENVNPNSKAIIEKPNINEESISNKHDKPNVYSKPESIGNTGKDIEMLDISDDYNNLGGITMEDSDLKKIDDKSPTTKGKQDKRITKKNKSNPNVNYKTTKPEIADSIGNMNFTDIKPDDQSSFINDHSYEKAKEEKPRDKSIVLVPKTDKRPKSEKGLSSDETVDKNSKMDIDGILHNVPKPNNFESEPLKPISNDDAVSGKINVIPTQSILKDDKDISHNIPENQKINDLVDKSVPSSIEELLNNPIDEDGLQLPSINFDETPIKPIEKNDNSLPNSEDYNIAFSIPHDHNTKNIFDKKKSMENLNPNSKAIIEKPNITEESISNKHDKPNVYSKPESIGNTGKDIEMLDISDDYNNLGGITMEDSDLKKIDDKSPTTKGKQDKRITKKNKSNPNVNYKTTKPEIADSIGNMNFTDIKPDDQSSFINDHSYEKAEEEKPRDKSIVLVPKTDKRPKSEKGLSSDETVDKNSKMDIDGILHNVPKPNNFESEPLKPISNDDAVSGKINVIPTQSILKDDKDISHNIPENQKINDLVDKSVPSSIEELLNNPIDEDGLQLPSINFDETPIKPIEKNDNSLPNSEDYNIAFSIPHDHNTKNIFDKKKSMENLNPNSKAIIEKPNITEESISNKHDKPNVYSKPESIGNTGKDIEMLDISDDYNNLGGITMEDSDLKKIDDKSPTTKGKQDKRITKKNKSNPNVNYKTTKPEIADSIGNMNFTDIKPDDQSSFINDHSYEKAEEEKPRDKSIVLVPKTDKRPMSEKGLSSDETVDKNSKMDIDGILHNVPKPNNFESEPLKPISNDDAVSGKINVIPTQSILKDDKDISHNIPENQKINDLVDKSVPSSIEELLNNPIDEDGLQLPSINFDETPIKPIEKNDNSLPNSEDYNIAFSIPHDHNTKNIFDKKKSMENLNPNSKAIIEKPNITEESISNKHDKPNVYSKPESIGNTGKDIEMLDISDDYNNLGGITMEDSDLKKIDDKSPTTKGKQDKRITKKNKSNPNVNYKTTKPEIADSIDNMNFTDIKPDDQSSFINDHSYEKAEEEKPRDKSIVLVPKTDKRPMSEKGLSSDETVDKNSKMDIDGILHNVPKPNNFESEPLNPISNDDAVSGKINVIPTQSILKDDKDISHNIPENQKINDLVDKSVPSSIEELLNNPIDEDGLQLPSINFDETPIKSIEKNDNSLPNSEDYNIAFSIPHDHNTKNIFDKKKSMENLNPNSKAIIEKPNITEESISNKHDKPNVYSKPESIGNTGKDIKMLDISDDYNNLGGITMEDSDLKKIDDKSPTTKGKQDKRITKKNKSNPNVNYKTTKPEIADSTGNMNFTDIKPDDQSSFINDHSYEKAEEEKPRDKSIVLVPKTDKRPMSEKGLSSDETVDKNSKMDIDGILHNVPKPNNFESEPLKPISNDDAVSGKINVIPTQSILKDDKDISHNIPENQKINDLVDKSVPSSIEELLNNPIDEDGLQLPSINFDETPIKPIEKNDNSLPNSEDYNIAFSIPHDHNTKNIFDKKKSMENLNPNSKAIIEKPNITEESISNKHDKPNVYSKPESIGNIGKDIEMLDISDDYNNLGGITMEDSDLKKIDDKSPTTKGKQDKRITKKNKSNPNVNYKTTKPEIADSIGNMNFTDIKPDDQSSFINDHSYEKAEEEKPRDKSIVLVPKTDKRPMSEKGLSSDETVDKNSKMDIDGILHNVPKPNNFESEPLKPISNDDAVSGKINVIPTQSILKDDKDISHNIPENQKINDLVDKSVPSSIEELLNNPIDEDGLQLPSINFDETPIKPIEKNDNSLPNSEDYNIAFSIPHDHNTKNIFDKKKSMENLNPNSKAIIEKPNITEESISNKHDKPNVYSKPESIGNTGKDIKMLDISDDYNNLGGITMEDSDLKKIDDKSPTTKGKQDKRITKKNKSNPNVNYKTTKPEIADSTGNMNFTDIKPDDQSSFINDHSYEKAEEEKPRDKSIVLVPKTDKRLNSGKGLLTNDTFDKKTKMDDHTILHKVPQPNSFVSETVDSKSNVIPITCISKDDEIPDINKTKAKLPNRIIIQKKTGNNIVPSTNVHENIFTGNSENEINLSNSSQYFFKPNSLNSKASNPDKHILITNEDEHSLVLNVIDKHNNSLLDEDEEINFNPGCETMLTVDNSKYNPVNRIKQQNNEFLGTVPNMEHAKNKTPYTSDYNLLNEDDNPYGYMLPKFSTKYIEGCDSNNLWETVPLKKNHDFSTHKESVNYNNDLNQSVDYTMNNIISSHLNSDKKIISETETVKNSYDDKLNTNIHHKMYDDFVKKMSEQLFKKIDNIDDKISKLDKLSNNSSYITQSYNLRSDDPGRKKIILMNDLPISKRKHNIEEPDSQLDSKINNSVDCHETMISDKSSDENVIKESTKPKKDKHKKHKRHNKKHKKHSKHDRHKKKKNHKKNDKNDSYNDDENDNNDDVDSRHKKYKIHKKNDKKYDDNKHKKNKSRKKKEMTDSDVDDDDDNGRVKKKSHKKNYINNDEVEVSRNKKTDGKKKNKMKENISPNESNEVNNSSSLQTNSEDDDSVKGLKIKSKSKNSKKTNSTKRKKSSPKKKSKHMKHSKSIKHNNKEIPVDVSDEDSSRNNNQNNVPKEKTHKQKKRKHKKHKKPLKTSKTYKYKEIPLDNEDKISDENNVNLEETYNINITNDDNALKQKRLRHKRLKKMKNIDINIVKDTDNQVLNRDTNTKRGYQFYTFYPQYRYTNPFARLFY